MFWERYCALCAEKGLSKTAAGKALGVSGNAVFNWKNGAEPHGETLDKVAAFFDCTTDYLLGRTDDRSPPEAKTIPAEAGEGGARTAEYHRRFGKVMEGLTDDQAHTLMELMEANAKILAAQVGGRE